MLLLFRPRAAAAAECFFDAAFFDAAFFDVCLPTEPTAGVRRRVYRPAFNPLGQALAEDDELIAWLQTHHPDEPFR